MKVHNITIGTAGHIDHGKSELIRELTGIHPDRLQEEKERGMTIDLGYSSYETSKGFTVGIIDVPGHERFIKNMVAGATSTDLVLLVVAADDGVMPQTREHLTIMTFLGIKRGVIALTKIDLVDEEMIELAIEDVRDLVRDSFLENAPIVPVSSLTGEGFDSLREALDAAVESVDPVDVSGDFRMPIQRVFTRKGFGTVVTGVPMSGRAKKGDPMEIFPHGVRGKIRTIQAYNEYCAEARAGHRTALNISDVDYRSLSRGDVAATPDFFRNTRFFEAEFHLAEDVNFPLENMTEVRVHTGTSEVMAGIVLLDKQVLEPGDSSLVQMRLRDPVVVVPGDCFILRLHSPMMTIGGGTIVGLTPWKLKRFKGYIVNRVTARRNSLGDIKALILTEAGIWPDIFFSPRDMALAFNASPDQVDRAVDNLKASNDLVEIQWDLFVHRERFDRLAGQVVSHLDEQHRLEPLTPYLNMKPVKDLTGLEGRNFTGFLDAMEKRGLVETAKGGLVRRAGFAPEPTGSHPTLMDRIEERIREKGATPPTRKELVNEITHDEENLTAGEAESAIQFMVVSGRFVRVGAFLFHSSVYEKMRDAVVEVIKEYGEVKFPVLRDRFKTTRKWIIPLLDHFDSIGLTCWVRNKRRLKENNRACQ